MILKFVTKSLPKGKARKKRLAEGPFSKHRVRWEWELWLNSLCVGPMLILAVSCDPDAQTEHSAAACCDPSAQGLKLKVNTSCIPSLRSVWFR